MKLILIFLISVCTVLAQTPEWSRKYHTGSVTCLDFSSDGGKILAGSWWSGRAILLNSLTGDSLHKYHDVQFNSITSVDFSPNSELFFINTLNIHGAQHYYIGNSKTDTLVELEYFEYDWKSKDPYYPNRAFVNGIRNSQSFWVNDTLIISYLSGTIRNQSNGSKYYDIDGSMVGLFNTKSQRIRMVADGISFIKNMIPSPSRQNFYLSTNTTRGEIIHISNTGDSIFTTDGGTTAAFSKNDSLMILAEGNNEIALLSVKGKYLQKVSTVTSNTTALGIDMRNRYYISAHADSTLRLWTPGIPNAFKRIDLQSPMTTLAISPDSVHFATGHADGTVDVWNIDSLAHYAVIDSGFVVTIDSISQSKYFCKGDDAEFSVSAHANSDQNLSYKWQKDGTDLMESDSVSGTSSSKLFLKGIDKSDTGKYSVRVAVSTSHPATATVQLSLVFAPPAITTQPQAEVKLIMGGYITLSVEVLDPTAAKYEWFKDGNKLDFTTPYLMFHNVGSYAVGTYTVRVTNPCGSVMSNESVLSFPTDIAEENLFKNIQFSAEPNPFKSSTTIHFSLPKSLKIKLAVTDILGKEIAVLKDELTESGEQSIIFKNDNLPDGMYYITLSGEGLLKTIPVQIAQ